MPVRLSIHSTSYPAHPQTSANHFHNLTGGNANALRDSLLFAARVSSSPSTLAHSAMSATVSTDTSAAASVSIPRASFISLPRKPSARLAYRFFPAASASKSNVRIVFLNGLGLPMEGWVPAIRLLLASYADAGGAPFSMLTYDRFGQGATTDRDPDDASAADPKHAHDVAAIAHDLHDLLQQVELTHPDGHTEHKLILVSNSLGGATTRLYAQLYPDSVYGCLFLDSVLANSNFVDIAPDPDAASFDAATLPPNVTADQLRQCRQKMSAIFHPSNGSAEGTSRRNLAALLPHADSPKLPLTAGGAPYVTVVGHGFHAFALESSKQFGMAESISAAYTNPYWQRYNEGLCQLTTPERSRGPIEAVGAGHFVQKDLPDLVVDEIRHLVTQVSNM